MKRRNKAASVGRPLSLQIHFQLLPEDFFDVALILNLVFRYLSNAEELTKMAAKRLHTDFRHKLV
jgi:hypothetical protein